MKEKNINEFKTLQPPEFRFVCIIITVSINLEEMFPNII